MTPAHTVPPAIAQSPGTSRAYVKKSSPSLLVVRIKPAAHAVAPMYKSERYAARRRELDRAATNGTITPSMLDSHAEMRTSTDLLAPV